MSDATLARMEHGKYVGVRGEPRRDGVYVLSKPTCRCTLFTAQAPSATGDRCGSKQRPATLQKPSCDLLRASYVTTRSTSTVPRVALMTLHPAVTRQTLTGYTEDSAQPLHTYNEHPHCSSPSTAYDSVPTRPTSRARLARPLAISPTARGRRPHARAPQAGPDRSG
jgi:hypothetical protein